jgi:integrase
MREEKIVELKLSQCDFVQGRINIGGTEMKNDEPFSIKMTPTVKETLLKVIKSRKLISHYVFVDDKGQPWAPNAVSVAFGRACKRAKIEDLRFHDLRHDFASLLINNGASLSQVQHALNQKDPRMAARYAHLFPENRDVVDRIDDEGTAGILLRVGVAGNSTTPLLPEGKKDKKKRSHLP